MVRCTNGLKEYEVTRGAFETFFKPNGYSIIEDVKNEPGDLLGAQDANGEPSIDENKELIEKPIAQWSKEEVRAFARENGIDISKTRNAAQAKELIKEFIDNMNQ